MKQIELQGANAGELSASEDITEHSTLDRIHKELTKIELTFTNIIKIKVYFDMLIDYLFT